MKARAWAAALAAVVASWAATASATVIDYTTVVDLDPSMFTGTSLNVPLSGGPIPLNVGDTLQGTITFANNGRITVFDNPNLGGTEWIRGIFSPDFLTSAQSTGTFSLLGVQGDYLLPATITSSNIDGAVGFSRNDNFTNSSFSFTGVTFSLTYVDTEPQDVPFSSHVTPSRFGVVLTPASISEGAAVPEPATWGMAILGLGMVGQLRRLQRRGLRSSARTGGR